MCRRLPVGKWTVRGKQQRKEDEFGLSFVFEGQRCDAVVVTLKGYVLAKHAT